jgi:hypothetical protein
MDLHAELEKPRECACGPHIDAMHARHNELEEIIYGLWKDLRTAVDKHETITTALETDLIALNKRYEECTEAYDSVVEYVEGKLREGKFLRDSSSDVASDISTDGKRFAFNACRATAVFAAFCFSSFPVVTSDVRLMTHGVLSPRSIRLSRVVSHVVSLPTREEEPWCGAHVGRRQSGASHVVISSVLLLR